MKRHKFAALGEGGVALAFPLFGSACGCSSGRGAVNDVGVESVLVQVASYMYILPRLKGKTVMLSGQRPSPRSRPHSSRMATRTTTARTQ